MYEGEESAKYLDSVVIVLVDLEVFVGVCLRCMAPQVELVHDPEKCAYQGACIRIIRVSLWSKVILLSIASRRAFKATTVSMTIEVDIIRDRVHTSNSSQSYVIRGTGFYQ